MICTLFFLYYISSTLYQFHRACPTNFATITAPELEKW